MENSKNAVDTVVTEAKTLAAGIQKLPANAKVADVVTALNQIIDLLDQIPTRPSRDRGPDSTREMTEDDARSILLGELKDASHKDAAKQLGLSYGQIYSARKGFTFKAIYKEWKNS